MRVSFSERVQGVLTNLEASSANLVQLQDELSSGKKLRQPSDDPAGTGQDLQLRAAQADNTQFLSNIDSSTSWLSSTGASLQDTVATLQRVRQLAVEASNGTLSATDEQAIGSEVHQLLLHAVSVGNAKFGNDYLFAGFATNVPGGPFTLNPTTDAVVYNGTVPAGSVTGVIQRQIAPGVNLGVNVIGTQGFPAVFAALSGLDTDLQTLSGAPLIQSITGTRLTEIDTAITQMTNILAEVGAKQNNLTVTQNRLQADGLSLSSLLSNVEDLDMAKAANDFSTAQTVYQAALQTGAKIIQTTLLNFLS